MDLKYILVCGAHFLLAYYLSKASSFIIPTFLQCFYSSFINITAFLLFLKLTFQFTKLRFLNEQVNTEKKAVFITGCDSGFGHLLAKRLDAKGFHVLAGCLLPDGEGASELRKWCSHRLRIVPLDVTQEDSVNAALETVKTHLVSSGTKLWALVNNAGIQKGLTVEMTSTKVFKEVMEVNAFGPLRMAKAFLPLIKETKGRIVNMISLSGKTCFPYMAPYAMSKFAAMAFNDSLQQEVNDWGIKVISVEPELFRTSLVEKVEERLQKDMSVTDSKESTNTHSVKSFHKGFQALIYLASPNIKIVVKDLESAVSLKYPDNSYKPRRNIFVRFLLFCHMDILPREIQFFIIKLGMYITNFPPLKG